MLNIIPIDEKIRDANEAAPRLALQRCSQATLISSFTAT
jgi:hypothetical protein